MRPVIQNALLWLWVILLGITVGAGLYESRIVVPQWLLQQADGWYWDAAAAREANTGVRFWAYISSGPLTLTTLAGLIVVFRAPAPVRRIWAGGLALGVLERVFTFAYFIPNMLQLMSGEMSQAEAVPLAQQWEKLNYLRHALSIATWIVALKALTTRYWLEGRSAAGV